MRLTDLEPRFVRYETRVETWEVVDGEQSTWRERGCPTRSVTGPRQYTVFVDSLQNAQGIWFLCPKCFIDHPDSTGVHSCDVTFEGRGATDDQGSHGENGRPTRWIVSGVGFEDLTTTPSILLTGGCAWHGFITNGEVSL